MQSRYSLVSGAVFGIVAIAQAIRSIMQWPVQIGPLNVPLWFSWIAVVIAGSLCVWAFRSMQR